MIDKKIFSVISKINGEERISALFADNLIQAKKQLEDSGLLQNHEVTGIRQATKSDLEHMKRIVPYFTSSYMNLDVSTRRNLELTETLREKKR